MSARKTGERRAAGDGIGVQVPDAAPVLARWRQASDLVRSQARFHADLRYGEAAQQVLDLYEPDAVFGAGRAPVLVFLPGLLGQALDKCDYAFLAASFCDEGALVVLPEREHGPAASLERGAVQCAEAVAWAWRHAADFGGDPARIVVAGHSSGGHLAAMLSTCDWRLLGRDLPHRLLRAAFALSGVYDMAPLARMPALQQDLSLDAPRVKRLSPVRFAAPRSPMTLACLVGGNESDELKRQAQLIRAAWGARAVPVCEELPGCDHLSVMHDLADPQGRSHQVLRRLLDLRWYSGLA
ncbi:MAG: esterase [Roseateles depolymerans]|uniref:Esterase n=1 Tax=Roseateles depolymerans TaxID=76731 RepID=A0A2W5E6M0_9BURK|nr:MAG: esterase [Roseateles depolymerans]